MTDKSTQRNLGIYLRSVRKGLEMSLRDVELASDKSVSNAYLSQIENGVATDPSPHILHSLAEVYTISYEDLMSRAGYLSKKENSTRKEKHGRAATFAIDNLNEEEEKELLEYLSYYRSKKR